MFKKKTPVPPPPPMIPADPIQAANEKRMEKMKAEILMLLEKKDITSMSFICMTTEPMVHIAQVVIPQELFSLTFEINRALTRAV